MPHFEYYYIYAHKKEKWFIVIFFTLTTILISPIATKNPGPLFMWLLISILSIIFVWTRKKSKTPKLIFDNTIIKTDGGNQYYISTIERIELKKNPIWLRRAPLYLVIYFKDNKGMTDIDVNGLNKDPDEILADLKSVMH